MSARPLFIPLKARHFDAFKSGEKTVEFRAWGPRWNVGTCPVGREVILSRGYGKADRLRGVVIGYEEGKACTLSPQHQADVLNCYGLTDIIICAIHIEIQEAA
ncbi:ASCH domain-containing protein [Nitratidesulfovibrio liaohensis]|uniref:ASCH domain-containing protein n=1 Tax=Nitratidesulfovibrio liaohensis TaxID=2604158 RepID=UPI00141E5203|nr:ASCH domain-containing protein [Nitratidesulfovibrio liaohensis]NHZ48612.1 ASCH domain-containing protein [Nitratidesulfovibrio liaohensis]